MKTEFLTNEQALAESSGVSLEQIREIREGLSEGADWSRVGRDVLYSKSGEKKVADALGLKSSDLKKKGEGEPPASKAGAVSLRTLYVKKTVRNPKILLAVGKKEEARDAAAPEFRVRVKDSRKFAQGMELVGCRHVQADLYAFTGKPPRSRKKW